jgi:hypothetical protein
LHNIILAWFLVVAIAKTNRGPKDDIPGVIYQLDSSPLLPLIELKAYAPDIIVKLLTAFMIAAWSVAIPSILKCLSSY